MTVHRVSALNRRSFIAATACGVAAKAYSPLGGGDAAAQVDPWAEADAIVARITVPTFPNRSFDITSFGAVGDGIADCSAAIGRALAAAKAAGGSSCRRAPT